MDAALRKKKERQHAALEALQDGSKGGMKVETNNTSQSTHISIQGCDAGMSPVMTKFGMNKKK